MHEGQKEEKKNFLETLELTNIWTANKTTSYLICLKKIQNLKR